MQAQATAYELKQQATLYAQQAGAGIAVRGGMFVFFFFFFV
jgi:hypothetical protein